MAVAYSLCCVGETGRWRSGLGCAKESIHDACESMERQCAWDVRERRRVVRE
jgi:hypothetical protein